MCRDQHSHGGMFSNSFGVCSVNVASLPWTTPILFSEQTLLAVLYIIAVLMFICCEYSVEKLRRGFGMRVPKLIVAGQQGSIITHGHGEALA
jgi:hypothetical protein